MNDVKESSKPWFKQWFTWFRLGFALIALIVVLRSVQYRDYLVRDKTPLQIISKTQTEYQVCDDKGTISSVSVEDKKYIFKSGATSLVQNMKIFPAVAAVGIFGLVPVLLVYRWNVLLKVVGVVLPLGTVIRLTFAGSFLNFFLIGTTGGDLVKAFWVGRFSPKRTEGFVSVFMDRFIGLVVLIFVSAIFVAMMWKDPQVAKMGRAIGILVILTALALIILFSRRTRHAIHFDRWKHKLPLSQFIEKIDGILITYRLSGREFLKAVIATAALQTAASLAAFYLGSALQIHASLWYYLLYVPLAFLIGSIPVSLFWGLGLLEGAYVGFFAGSGFATVTQAAMLAMAVRLVQLLWAIPGSIFVASGIKPVDQN